MFGLPRIPQPLVCRTLILFAAVSAATLRAESAASTVLQHPGETIVLEPYAPNIIRVTLSKNKTAATAEPGYGFVAFPSNTGWAKSETESADVLASARLRVSVDKARGGGGKPPLQSMADIARYFNGSAPGAHIKITTADGQTLTDMTGWAMSDLNNKDGDTELNYDRRSSDPPFFRVGAYFHSPDDEHYYGLGQNQEGYLDHRGHPIRCWHDYDAPAGPSVGVPFLVTNKGYGLIWDNPSKTTVQPGFNEQTIWMSEAGRRVSYFVIAGRSSDEIYAGYRELTGATPLLSKAAYGFIQCKQRYASQAELMAVANGYRERHLPLDVLVVDWFYFSRMGQMDMVPEQWPDPAAMNKQLHAMKIQTMISVWPRFERGTRYYDTVLKNGWFEHLEGGTPTNGLPYDRAGSDIDTTNPDAGKWFWSKIRENFIDKGFNSIWADETEPDLPPNGSYLHVGPGTEFFNAYPLFHTGAIYDGFRRDTKQRAVVLSRDAYLGAQRNGTIFWSSDIHPTWDTLRRQVPTGLDFTASGLANWSNDIGGWQYLPSQHHSAYSPLLDPSDCRQNVGGYDDYPELYTRWFEYGVFQPIFRTHGSRRYNEVWSYGKQAEPILSKYLKLRYQLMPYIYSLAYRTNQTGAPAMRALFMDFPHDPKVADLGDEYMFGPAFLVAPVTQQGQTTRQVYLPAGTRWFNYWTNQQYEGGQTVEVAAPIDTLPLFVKAGSIIPEGAPIESTAEKQAIVKLRIYPGADTDFTLYDDDGTSYAYASGTSNQTHLHWDDTARKLTHHGPKTWTLSDSEVVQVIGR